MTVAIKPYTLGENLMIWPVLSGYRYVCVINSCWSMLIRYFCYL